MASSSGLRNIFGLAVSAMYMAANQANFDAQTKVLLCEAFAQGFGLSPSDGDSIYTYLKNSEIFGTNGFDGNSHYINYQTNVLSFVTNNIPGISGFEQQTFAIAANACLFAFSVNSTLSSADMSKLLGDVLGAIAYTVNKHSIFPTADDGSTITPFTPKVVLNLLKKNYSLVVDDINTSSKNTKSEVTNYNWYDTTEVFAGPDLQVMKDIENQYYYLSGKMFYESMLGRLPLCIEQEVTIPTYTGDVTTTYYANTPCVDPANFVGPPDVVSFKRIFNDGPGSSGRMTDAIEAQYQTWDKEVLDPRDYQSNDKTLYNFTTGSDGNYITIGNTFIDDNGRYSIPVEYTNAPLWVSDCSPDVQRMHIGDTGLRVLCSLNFLGDCICSTGNLTGFKFAALEIEPQYLITDFLYSETNPVTPTGRIGTRVLSLSGIPYLATQEGDVLMPYYTVNPNPPTWYVGPPQLNGKDALPEWAFWQTMDNQTFGDFMHFVLYPSIGVSAGNAGDDSQRTYTISDRPIISGKNPHHISYTTPLLEKVKFNQVIPSNFSGYDNITKQFFGMGDAFSGAYSITDSYEENAGFFYTGFTVTGREGYVNLSAILADYESYKLGSPVKTMKYISGYSVGGVDVPVSQIYSQDASGNLVPYYYFDNRVNTAQVANQSNWASFAPLPAEFDGHYTRLWGTERVENYLPRYWSGPFSVEDRKFLYPNAKHADAVYFSRKNGFPIKITFHVKVREEAVRELFGSYQITPDGAMSTNPTYKPVIRTDNGHNLVSTVSMRNMFVPDNSFYNSVYDINNYPEDSRDWVAGVDLVDAQWAPLSSRGAIPSGKNNSVYNSLDAPSNIFHDGVKKTGQGALAHHIYTGAGGSDYYDIYSEIPVNIGLYDGYRKFENNVTLYYTPPIFNLESGLVIVTDALTGAFPIVTRAFDSINQPYGSDHIEIDYADGTYGVFQTGVDPIFGRLVGGRRGGPTAILEGGYHPRGLIGDAWLGECHNAVAFDNYNSIDPALICKNRIYRDPEFDDALLVFNGTTTGTTIYTNGLKFAPLAVQKVNVPFIESDIFNIKVVQDGVASLLHTSFSGGFISFDASQFFLTPKFTTTGNEWYSTGGISIGPFDRDIEIGIFPPNSVVAYNQFYINGEKLTDFKYASDQSALGCEINHLHSDIFVNSGIYPGQANRNPNYSIIKVIPSGQTINLNVFNPNPVDSLGMQTGAILSIRAQNYLYASQYDSNLFLGEEGLLNPFHFVDNEAFGRFFIPNKFFTDLIGTHTITSFTQSGKLYPIPDSTDFRNHFIAKHELQVDANGNDTYATLGNVEQYWKDQAFTSRTNVYVSGWREGVRVSFQISDISVTYDTIPFHDYNVVIPSGHCTVSGEFGYLAQADNSLFMEGFHLQNWTVNDTTTGNWNPEYVSDVLHRLSGYQNMTGTITAPILDAPSTMIQRLNPSGIIDGQEYVRLLSDPPNNYNKYFWPALSDLETLNPGETLESIPPDDGNTFTNDTMLFSAAQGQVLPNGLSNPNIQKIYAVVDQYQMYDSVATDSLLNSGIAITQHRGQKIQLNRSDLTGIMTLKGMPITLALKGLT